VTAAEKSQAFLPARKRRTVAIDAGEKGVWTEVLPSWARDGNGVAENAVLLLH
jgi:hypothetical protein